MAAEMDGQAMVTEARLGSIGTWQWRHQMVVWQAHHLRFNIWFPRLENRFEVRGNRTGKGWFVKGRSANPGGRPKEPPILPGYAPDPTVADRRPIPNLVVEAFL